MEKPRWEQVTDNGSTWRLRVPGGWLVRYSDDVIHDRSEYGQGYVGGWDWRSCITFVSDPNWQWEV